MIWLYSDPFDYSDLKWPDEENEMFSIEQRNQYDLVDGGKFFRYKIWLLSTENFLPCLDFGISDSRAAFHKNPNHGP